MNEDEKWQEEISDQINLLKAKSDKKEKAASNTSQTTMIKKAHIWSVINYINIACIVFLSFVNPITLGLLYINCGVTVILAIPLLCFIVFGWFPTVRDEVVKTALISNNTRFHSYWRSAISLNSILSIASVILLYNAGFVIPATILFFTDILIGISASLSICVKVKELDKSEKSAN